MKTLIFFLDAFRHDDLKRDYCPYLHKLASGGASGRLNTLAGYHVEYSMLSGYYPLKHNAWIWYYYDKENSCFRWARKFNFIFKTLDSMGLRNIGRSLISYGTMLLRYFKGNTRFLKVNEIPLEKIDKFNISVNKFYTDKNSLNVPTLFDTLMEKNKKYFAIEYPWISTNKGMKLAFFKGSDKSNFDALKNALKKDYEVIYCHIWNLDSMQHKYGIRSRQVLEQIKFIDDSIKEIVECEKLKNDVNVVVFSDHGMTPVKGTIDAFSVIKDYDADYFLGSTMVQVWLNDKSKKEEIKQRFLKLNCLAYDEKNIEELKIPYVKEYTGDLLIAAKPGCQFYPDFFRKDCNAMAMHGYTIKNKDLDCIFIINGPGIKKIEIKNSSLVDIVPTTLKLLGIETGRDYDGKARI